MKRKCNYRKCDNDITEMRLNAKFCCRNCKDMEKTYITRKELLLEKYKQRLKYKIYKLIYNGIVQYVGRTTITLKQRKSAGYGKNTELFKSFNIELIEETDDISRERYWISYYRDINPNLFNIQSGDTFDKKDCMKIDDELLMTIVNV